MARLSLAFLGSFRLSLNGQALAIRSARIRALLAYLALEPAHAHTREALAALFWPDAPEHVARQNLRQALYQLSRLLGELAEPFLLLTRDSVQRNAACEYALDVAAFLGHLEQGRLREAAELYQFELLTDLNGGSEPLAEWLALRREQLHLLALDALHQLAEQALAGGKAAQAQEYARHQLALEPWCERAHRQLMLALARDGDRSSALAQYEVCRRALAAELQAEPEPETSALYAQIRDNDVPADPRPSPAQAHPRWSRVPDTGVLYGRTRELAQLRAWLTDDRCRLVAIVGMGGMGKTTLAARLARECATQFDRIIWRSLLNAPPPAHVLRECVALLNEQQVADLSEQPDTQLELLTQLLAQQRCLLVLDNYESVLQAEARAGAYRPGYELYGQLLQRVAETAHASCVLVTSREQPQGFALLQSTRPQVQSLQLEGLTTDAGQGLLQARGLAASGEAARLVGAYSGSPLALILVAETIQATLGGDIGAFFRDEAPIFDDIRTVLDQQWQRLTALEQDVALWLAIEREPVAADALQANLHAGVAPRPMLEALRSLQSRSLLEQREGGFTLQNVLMEYVSDQLIEQVCAEITAGCWERFRSHALIKAQAKEYVRESQVRLILEPAAARLVARLGRDTLARALHAGLARLREGDQRASGYAAGNALNLLLHLRYDLAGFDFSHLCVWQAHLRGARLPTISFAHADLSGSVFTDTFHAVEPVAWSPDGALLAAGTGAGEIRLWRKSDWQIVGVCAGHTGIVWSIAWSPDGARLVSGGADATVRVWDVDTHQIAHVLTGHTQAVTSVCFSPDGAMVASAGLDRSVRLWDARSGVPSALLQGHIGSVSGVAFSPDGALVASSSADWSVRVWAVGSGAVVRVLAHPAEVRAVAWRADGQVLASGCADHAVRLWDLRSEQLLHTLCRHTDALRSLAFSPDGMSLASSGDRLIWLWDTSTGRALRALHGHTGLVVSVAWSPDGAMLASRGDETIRIWSSRTGQLLTTLHGHSAIVFTAAWSPDGATLASGHFDGTVLLWDAASGTLRHALSGHVESTTAVRWSPDGGLLASAGLDGVVRLWDLCSEQPSHTLRGHTKGCGDIAWSLDGALLASAGYDHTVRVWDARAGHLLRTLYDHKTLVFAVAWSPDGSLLASGDAEGVVHLWDTGTWQLQRTIRQEGSNIEALAFSPDGALLASGGSDRLIWIWPIGGERALCQLEGHDEQVSKIAWSPDGAMLASASLDATVRLWDMRGGRALHTLRGHTSWVFSVAWRPDGQRVVSSSHDGTIRLWDANTGACLRVLRAPGPYAGMDITGATGITEAQRISLRALGAMEQGREPSATLHSHCSGIFPVCGGTSGTVSRACALPSMCSASPSLPSKK